MYMLSILVYKCININDFFLIFRVKHRLIFTITFFFISSYFFERIFRRNYHLLYCKSQLIKYVQVIFTDKKVSFLNITLHCSYTSSTRLCIQSYDETVVISKRCLSLIVLVVTSCIVSRRELPLIYLARLIPLLLRHQLIEPAVNAQDRLFDCGQRVCAFSLPFHYKPADETCIDIYRRSPESLEKLLTLLRYLDYH